MWRALFVAAFSCLLMAGSRGADLRKIQKALEKAEYASAYQLISKSIASESPNPGAKYYGSVLFSTLAFEGYHLDSANRYIRMALTDLSMATENNRKDLMKAGLIPDDFRIQQEKVTKAAFKQALGQMNFNRWEYFIDKYKGADEMPKAVFYRDSLAFENALQFATPSAFEEFLENYPNSVFAPRAKSLFEKVLLLQLLKKESPEEWRNFLKSNQVGQNQKIALAELMRLLAVEVTTTELLTLIKEFRHPFLSRRAINTLFYRDKTKGFIEFEHYVSLHPNPDSLREAKAQSIKFHFPSFEQGGFYSLDGLGKKYLLKIDELDKRHACEGFSHDWIGGVRGGTDVVLTKSGNEILTGKKVIRPVGEELVLVSHQNSIQVYHVSGFLVLDNVEDAEMLPNGWVKVKEQGRWGLMTVLGLKLTEPRYDGIFMDGPFWIFKRGDLMAVSTEQEIKSNFRNAIFLELKFDDYERFGDRNLLGFRGDKECLLNDKLQFIVPWGEHHIYPRDKDGYLRDEQGYAYYNLPKRTYYPYLQSNNGFETIREKPGKWKLRSRKQEWSMDLADSVQLLNDYCAWTLGANSQLVFQNLAKIPVKGNETPIVLAPGKPFIWIKTTKTQRLLDGTGKAIIEGEYEEFRLIADSLFVVKKAGRFGLMHRNGKTLIDFRYDQITQHEDMLVLLRGGRLGSYDLKSGQLFAPNYDARFERAGNYFITRQNGKAGMLDAKSKSVLPFNYDEIIPVSDTLAWAKKGAQHLLINLKNQVELHQVTRLTIFIEGKVPVVKYYGERGFGILGANGTLIDPIYNEIVLIGTAENGLIVAEQALLEADYYVVTYFNMKGEKIYSQAYRAEDYDKIACEE
jgi:hypothetical protein